MGTLLSKPNVKKTVFTDMNNELMYGYCGMQGWRYQMEDMHSVVLNMDYPFNRWSFFGVFDGHNGAMTSKKCCSHLISIILQTTEFQHMKFDDYGNPINMDSLRIGIRRGFLSFDDYLRTLPEMFSGNDQSGSTAICAIVTPRYVVFVNCGDSRGVLIRDSLCYFGTRDHKPFDPEEYKRITNAGGTVISERINGSLALSRALGDFIFKKSTTISAQDQIVSADPTISIFERVDSDQMIVLCSDGIWDVMTNDELCHFLLSRCLRNSNLGKIAEDIVNLCFYKGSKDNMTVIIVCLRNYMIIDDGLALEDEVLDQRIREIVQEYFGDHPSGSMASLLKWMQSVDLHNLPPGGLLAKGSVVEEELTRLKAALSSVIIETPDSLRSKNRVQEEL